MSDSQNKLILIGGAALVYLMMSRPSRNMQGYPTPGQGQPYGSPSMPGSSGGGNRQIAVGALAGFLAAVAGPQQGTYQPNYSEYDVYNNGRQAGTAQDAVTGYNDAGYNASGWF